MPDRWAPILARLRKNGRAALLWSLRITFGAIREMFHALADATYDAT